MTRGWKGILTPVATTLPVLTLFPRHPQLDVVRLPDLVSPGLTLHSHPCRMYSEFTIHAFKINLTLLHQSWADQIQTLGRLRLVCGFPGKACAAGVQRRINDAPLKPTHMHGLLITLRRIGATSGIFKLSFSRDAGWQADRERPSQSEGRIVPPLRKVKWQPKRSSLAGLRKQT